jgi:hypothetical protein
MLGSRFGLAAVLTAGALWAQLILLPLVAAWTGHAHVSLLALAAAAVALGLAVAGFSFARERPRVAATLLLGAFPAAIGATGVLGGPRPWARFDPGAWSIAALTATGFVAATLAWSRQLAPAVPASVAAMDAIPQRPPAPPLRGAAMILLASIAGFLAVVAPAVITTRAASSPTDHLAGADLVRARDALTSAGGLALAVLLVLGAGRPLFRGRAARRRRSTRGLAYLVWGVATAMLLILLHARSLWVARWFHALR